MLENKTILITGGSGSFGKAFTEKVLRDCNPKKIIIYSRDEYKQFKMKELFIEKFGKEKASKLRFFIGDVRDLPRLQLALKDVDYVVHAAALKQVPACEYNPAEAIKTNIGGAQNVIDACLNSNVKKVVALSTDKAVNPINLYGGTKLVSDKLFISANAYCGSRDLSFSIVRYGNVAGSRGSVIPFFQNLIEQGVENLPITDVNMTRFWMILDKAVNLVLLTLEKSRGGETFVYKNPSFNIVDLAAAMAPDKKIDVVGIREGEKIHECMITTSDSYNTYDYGDYYVIYPNFEWYSFDKHFIEGGKKVQPQFEYTSGNNADFLSVEDLKNEISKMKIEY